MAAPAALPRPRSGFVGGVSRRRLRSVPAQAGPVARLELGNPLQLSKSMRSRLLAAVRALVSSPALAGASDGARLASVVLAAKARVREDYRASIWAAELGRWLGVSRSTVAHTVLPELRAAGVLDSNVVTNSFGHATGLECWVIPMYRAQQAADRRHPLALSRSELAVLLRLLEVLFGPGWAPKDKPVVPAGLLASRTGRGAATDRLGLLLMVLTTGPAGWLQLCPGSVDTGRGRPAATVARLLGCTAAAGAKVLGRLQEHGVADVVRKETGSGLHAQSRVRLVPVAQAHGVAVREARRVAKSLVSDLAGTASGDLESGEAGESLVTTAVEVAGQDGMGGSADLSAAAQHHALHASVVTPGGPHALVGGFSGEGRGGSGELPDRACVREGGGPLRGERHRPASSSSGSGPVDAGLERRVPRVAALLREITGSVSGFQRGRLSRLVEGLLLEGEGDAEIAARLRERLAPLVTGDPRRPFAFRRDGLSWALSVGLPYVRGGLTLVPCARWGCGQVVRGRATDRVRCDECELAVHDEVRAVAARRAWELANASRAGGQLLREQVEECAGAGPRVVLPAPCEGGPSPDAAVAADTGAAAGAGEAVRAAATGGGLPGPVREVLEGLAVVAPGVVATAEGAARVLYAGPSGGGAGAADRRDAVAAAAVWQRVFARYADELAAYHARESAA
ncbi:hypothetical protein FHS40_008332 [Streptomyces spectabilis]|uniref:Uncharacterized protein n=1 Tax=Streptomyces spectabilis TaxID=68270 RepID=A0A7W8B2K6_STRST|nr:hypothetical protein [Streptomyces spectabilis]